MPYVTYVQSNTAVYSGSRMTMTEMIQAELYGEQHRANHSKNFFNTHTFWTDLARPYQNVIMAGRLRDALRVTFEREYIEFRIPKASGGTRLIEAPAMDLKIKQKAIAQAMYDMNILPHNAAYAYTRGRCAYDALVTHQRHNARWFLKIDLKDFFPSITSTILFQKLPEIWPLSELHEHDMNHLINISINERSVLPQGSPLSPMLSNLIMVGFDKDLTKALKRFEHQTYCYTRYADDLLISCPFTFDMNKIVNLVKETLEKHGLPFQINMDKLRYASMAGRNWNLGLMYNQEQQITVGTKRKKQLHALVENFCKDFEHRETWWTKQQTQELIGQLAYLKNIEPSYHDKLIARYEERHTIRIKQAFKDVLNQ